MNFKCSVMKSVLKSYCIRSKVVGFGCKYGFCEVLTLPVGSGIVPNVFYCILPADNVFMLRSCELSGAIMRYSFLFCRLRPFFV